MHLSKPATARVARSLRQASAVAPVIEIDERHLAQVLELSYNTVRLAVAALDAAGALTAERAQNGRRAVTVHPAAEYWDGLDGAA